MPWDKLWCTEAQKRGYDSIQVFHPKGAFLDPYGHKLMTDTELVMCTGCDKAALHGACPPLELRRASFDTRPGPCKCSSRSDNLNCGDEESFMLCQA